MVTQHDSLSAADARRAVAAILDTATAAEDRPAAVAVVGPDGDLLCCVRQDGAAARLISRARAKAYTAAVLGVDTVVFRDDVLSQPGRSLADWADPWITSLQGGVTVVVDGQVVGAIGCAGNPTPRDEALARLGAESIDTATSTPPRNH